MRYAIIIIVILLIGISAFYMPRFSGDKLPEGAESGSTGEYVMANTDWLAACRYGVGVHWTAQTVPLEGEPLPFREAVGAFDLESFVNDVDEAGAEYVLFTITHALQMIPAPHPALERILPGRSAERDNRSY